jgi:predicted transposase YdaD
VMTQCPHQSFLDILVVVYRNYSKKHYIP